MEIIVKKFCVLSNFGEKKKPCTCGKIIKTLELHFFVIEYLQISQLSNHLLCNCEMRENLCEKDNFGP